MVISLPNTMNNTTLLFLIKKNQDHISEICLAMKKRSFGAGRWNGVGGKLLPGETIPQALIRETKEEINVEVQVGDLSKVAELTFTFPDRPDFDQLVHVFVAEIWMGEPTESEEMRPEWFSAENIPFDTMWPDDKFWLPQVVQGKYIQGAFTFGEQDAILEQEVREVEGF